MRLELEKGTRIDLRELDLKSLEVDTDALIRGNLTVYGSEIVNLIEEHYADLEIHEGNQLKIYDANDTNYGFLKHDGTKLQIGMNTTANLSIDENNVYISGGKLTSDLDCNYNRIEDVFVIKGGKISDAFYFEAHRSASYTGDAYIFRSKNSSNSLIPRLVITGGIDQAEVKIENADLKLGTNKLEFNNLLIKEHDNNTVSIRNIDDTAYKNLRLSVIYASAFYGKDTKSYIQTPSVSATNELHLRSGDGSNYVTNLKLAGGYVYLYNAVLNNNLNVNGNSLTSVSTLAGRVGDYYLYIVGKRTSAFPGDAIKIKTYNSSDVTTDRIVITGGVDQAEIRIDKVSEADSTNTVIPSNILKFRGAYWDSVNSVSVDVDASIYLNVLDTSGNKELVIDTDINLGSQRLRFGDDGSIFPDVYFMVIRSDTKGIRLDPGGGSNVEIYASDLEFPYSNNIKTNAGATYSLGLQSHNDTEYVTNIKLQGGYVHIYNGILDNDLNVNGYKLKNIGNVYAYAYEGVNTDAVYRSVYGNSVPLRVQTMSSDLVNWSDRINITSGVDVADVKFLNCNVVLDSGVNLFWSSGAYLRDDQGGSIELGDSLSSGVKPYIDFHYGTGSSQDYNVRLINDADGQLHILFGSGSKVLNVGGKIEAQNILPLNDNSYSLGSSSYRWANLYVVTVNASTLKGTLAPSYISPQGSGSGLDADKLDGKEGSYYLDFNNLSNRNSSLITVNSSWIPNSNNSYDLGSSSYKWRKAYLGSFQVNGSDSGIDNVGLVIGNLSGRASGERLELYGSTSSMVLSVQDGNGRIQMKWNATRGTSETFLAGGENAGMWEFDPSNPGTDLLRVRYADGSSASSGDAITWSDVLYLGTNGLKIFYSGIYPGSDNSLDLGDSSLRWRNLYAVTVTTGDLLLHGNGARWRIIEGKDGLYVVNEDTGKKYRIVLEEVN